MITATNTSTLEEVPRVVEIVGPAGAGKSTICNLLRQSSSMIQLGEFPSVRKLSCAPFFLRYGCPQLISLMLLRKNGGRRLTYREFVWLTILRGWPSILRRAKLKDSRAIVLDQGPIYLFAELNQTGPQYLRNQNNADFWFPLYTRWANTLDLVVWLDTDNQSLLDRIHSRDKWHIMKDKPSQKIFEFLTSFRETYDQVLSNLSANGKGPRVLRFDTGNTAPDAIVERVLLELGYDQHP